MNQSIRIDCYMTKRLVFGQAIFIQFIDYNLLRRFECIDEDNWSINNISLTSLPNIQSIRYRLIGGDYTLSKDNTISNVFFKGQERAIKNINSL